MSVSIHGVRVVTSIGYNISPSKWDDKKQRVKQGCSNAKGVTYNTINARISEITAFFSRYEEDLKIHNKATSIEDLRSLWGANFKSNGKGKGEDNAPKTLLAHFDMFVADSSRASGWAPSTLAKFKTLRTHITNFCSEPTFETFNRKGLLHYTDYLRLTKGFRNSSILKNLTFLRWFLRWAVTNGHSTNTDFDTFRPKLKSSDKRVIFLTWDELMTVYNYRYLSQRSTCRECEMYFVSAVSLR
ncbi:MAG: phage integrase SAM-like domain-containing protein [Rikenellaceae bacterium]